MIQKLILEYGIYIVALLILTGELGIPTGAPAEIALLIAGSEVVNSVPELIFALVLVILSDVVGSTILHLAARTGGVRLLETITKRKSHDRSITHKWYERLGRRDALLVFVMRLIPIVRMWASAGTGLLRIPFRSFLIGSIPASIIWTGAPLLLGYLLRHRIHNLITQYGHALNIVLIVLGILVLLALVAWWIRGGRTGLRQIRRVQLALSIFIGIATATYLYQTGWQTSREAVFDSPALITYLAMLAIIVIGILWTAVKDTQLAHSMPDHERVTSFHFQTWSTVLWVVLVIALGTFIAWLEIGTPGL